MVALIKWFPVPCVCHRLFSPDLDLTEGEDAEESVEDVPGAEEEGAEQTDGADGAEPVDDEPHQRGQDHLRRGVRGDDHAVLEQGHRGVQLPGERFNIRSTYS